MPYQRLYSHFNVRIYVYSIIYTRPKYLYIYVRIYTIHNIILYCVRVARTVVVVGVVRIIFNSVGACVFEHFGGGGGGGAAQIYVGSLVFVRCCTIILYHYDHLLYGYNIIKV